MSHHCLFTPVADPSHLQKVLTSFEDEEALKKARIHPINILIALQQYKSGRGDRGGTSWTPNQKICDALDGAFYKAFKVSFKEFKIFSTVIYNFISNRY